MRRPTLSLKIKIVQQQTFMLDIHIRVFTAGEFYFDALSVEHKNRMQIPELICNTSIIQFKMWKALRLWLHCEQCKSKKTTTG